MNRFTPSLTDLNEYDRRFIVRMAISITIGLAICTGLQVASYLIQQHQIAREADTATRLDLGGTQRMKSQRVALLSMALIRASSEETRERTKNALLSEVSDMERIHHALAEGDLNFGISEKRSEAVNEIFHGTPHLDAKMRKFIRTAAAFALEPAETLTAQNPLLFTLTESSAELLELLKDLTDQYRREGAQGIKDLHSLSVWALLWTIFVVLIVARYIFYPVFRRLKIEFFERTKIQEEVAEQNRELEQFSALVAHDLKAPLNNISGFGQFLKLKIKSQDNQEAMEFAEQIEIGVNRMSQMINDTLRYTKLSQHERRFEPIDLDALVKKVLVEFSFEIDQVGATLEIAKLPCVKGNPVAIEHLFHNLVSNALKYRDPSRAPIIRIFENTEIVVAHRFTAISVQDNGRGFQENERERMFQPFKRLIKDVEGSGFGLALCRKIMKHHHGSIVADIVPGGGSIFTISIPAA